MNPASTIPIEIVTLIIKYCAEKAFHMGINDSNSADNPFLHRTSVKELLSLRVLGKSWAAAIPPVVYQALRLQSPWAQAYISGMWSKGVIMSSLSHHHLRRLALDRVMYLPSLGSESFYEGTMDHLFKKLESEYEHYNTKSMSMNDATKLILLCSSSLTDLKIGFTGTVGFSDDLVLAIQAISSLKSFSIEGDERHNIMNNADSLIEILNHTDLLESLSLKFSTLGSLAVRDGALPQLVHFWVALHCENLNAINDFCQAPGRRIKLLEFSPTSYVGDSEAMIRAMRSTLEGLFIDRMPDRLPDELRFMRFPKLRIFRNVHISPSFHQPAWFGWPFFEAVNIFITSYDKGNTYWRKLLEEFGDLRMPLNLKRFIFVTGKGKVIKDERNRLNTLRAVRDPSAKTAVNAQSGAIEDAYVRFFEVLKIISIPLTMQMCRMK
ncbi:uncharacterized protein MELLADRAFT_101955 [Melampsora larici-populina 98AG31]|uniref:F-box domain-containing protein n=1 Tax=Melampsora larici-populina (strain 98AG31 / pathotype 3-4-7) TaxID=747676 RepID=F4R5H3_MELLP|nr:uncharacterized protein MELLADRAFT_101955 [Melampsora larici-populina 98AG31]EGG12047.1 hypothetical protein MELLADRAFT_101955 [Melampsora larici-populina 98AG31]